MDTNDKNVADALIITDRKESLEKLVAQRTADLSKTNRLLRQRIARLTKAERERKSSGERLSMLFELASDAYYLCDLEGNFLDVNKAAEEMTGYARKELIGKNVLEAGILSSEKLAKAAGLVTKGETAEPEELSLTRKDGSRVPVETRTLPMNVNGRNLMLVIARDIAQRKQAKQQLTRNYQTQAALNAILLISLMDVALQEQLELIVKHIVSLPWLALEPTGAIFLVENDPDVLVMKAHHGFAEALLTTCARVPFGRCLCGRAALSGETQYARGIDERHQNRYEGMPAHGHYCVPIVSGKKVLGAIVLYLKEGRSRDEGEEQVLRAIANVVAGVIERKQAQETLRESERRYRLVTDNVTDVIYVTDMQMRPTYMSPSIRRLTGYSAEEAMGRGLETALTPASAEVAARALTEDLPKERTESKDAFPSRTLELEMNHKDGSTVWTETTVSFLRDHDGHHIGLLGIIRDITQRRQAEELFRALFNSSPIGTYIAQHGKFQVVNPQFQELTEYSEVELRGMDSLGLVLPEDRSMVRKNAVKMLKGERLPTYEFRLATKTGQIKWMMEKITSIQYQGERASLGTAIDITERKRVEEALRRSARQWQTTFDAIGESVCLLDGEQRIVQCNKATSTLLRKPTTEIVGRHCWEVVHETRERPEWCPSCQVWKTLRRESSVALMGNRWVEVSVDPILDKAGHVIGAVHIIADITERKLAEEEWERLNAELADKNKELEQIVYITSHDLRSPLVNIQGFSKELQYSIGDLASILQDEELPPKVRERISSIIGFDIPESLEYIQMSMSKMDALLSALLRLSRAGRSAPNPVDLDMKSLISDIVTAFEFRIREAGVSLQIGELPHCMGDIDQVHQVFSNIIDNALKYLDPLRKGIVKITGQQEKNRVIYCIEDNGIGIPKEQQEKVFEIFHRVNPQASTGEGLGLTIVKKIVGRHHGSIWVESEPGVGSRFYVSLPAAS